MKTLISLLAAISLSGCVHIDQTTAHPIEGVLLDHDGAPIAGAQVWAYCRLPGGIVAAPKTVSWGPGVTDSSGRFRIDMESISMVQTGSIFDGSTTPTLLAIDRQRGCIMRVETEDKKDLGFVQLRFPAPNGPPMFGMIDELDSRGQAIARTFVFQQR